LYFLYIKNIATNGRVKASYQSLLMEGTMKEIVSKELSRITLKMNYFTQDVAHK